jgi:hypothetical protein
MLFVLQFADAFDAAGMLMLSQLLLLPLIFSFVLLLACYEICVPAAIACAIADVIC